MKKRLILAGCIAVTGLLAQGPGGPRPGGPRGGGPGFGPPGGMGPRGSQLTRSIANAPYSAVEETIVQRTLPGGNQIERKQHTSVFRDSQGRTRIEETFPAGRTAGQTRTHVQISDPVAGVIRDIDVESKTVHEMPVRRGPGQGQGFNRPNNPNGAGRTFAAPAPDPNVVTEDLGVQTINGVAAKGSRTTRTIPAGTIGNTLAIQTVHESWFSEDLHLPVLVKTSDPRSGTSVRQLTNINRAEPDASLFQAPTGFTVRRGGGRGPQKN